MTQETVQTKGQSIGMEMPRQVKRIVVIDTGTKDWQLV